MFAKRLVKIAIIGSLAAVPIVWQAAAQAQQDQPYAGLQQREIKALSREQMDDLASGRGMGLALTAELNGYPGPRHVLELAGQLALTDEQRTSIQRLFDSTKSEAIPVGQKLLSAERNLNRAFADRTITPERLETATTAIAGIQGELRNAHLKYHLATAAVLNPDQLRRYNELRGYAGTGSSSDASPGSGMMQPGHGGMDESLHPHMMAPRHQ
jgi:Spy/CpxP family protein refolding chaperone